MIIKVQTNIYQDRFLAEAAYIKWVRTPSDFVFLEVYRETQQTKRIGDTSLTTTGIDVDGPSLRLQINDGDHVYIMNNEGKTIDSKHIVIDKEKETCEQCGGRGFRRRTVIQNGQSSLVPYPCPECNPKPKNEPSCLQCGHVMGEREGVPLCTKCNPKPEEEKQ